MSTKGYFTVLNWYKNRRLVSHPPSWYPAIEEVYRGSSTRGQSFSGQNERGQPGNMNLTYIREQDSSSLNYNDSSMQLDQASMKIYKKNIICSKY